RDALARIESVLAADPFDLEQGPVVRARFVCLSPTEHRLLLCSPHIVLDNWSVRILLDDLAALYASACERQPSSLSPLAIRYVDYASWQNERIANGAIEADARWWAERLSGMPPELMWPAEEPTTAPGAHRAHSERLEVDPKTTQALRAIAERSD